jgi:hypothetical protein
MKLLWKFSSHTSAVVLLVLSSAIVHLRAAHDGDMLHGQPYSADQQTSQVNFLAVVTHVPSPVCTELYQGLHRT